MTTTKTDLKNQLFLITRTILLSVFILLTFIQCGDKSTDTPIDPDQTEVKITPNAGMDLYGFIGDQNKTPIEGVVVSDGFTCTKTDSKGIYQMKRNTAAKFVFYSTPSEYAINTISDLTKMAAFYASISATPRHDFSLKKLAAIETKFTLLCIGDPQVTSTSDVNRFKTETMADIKTLLASTTTPCYGLTMGDMTGEKYTFNEQMKVVVGSSSMPVFATIGNHDKAATTVTSEPRTTDTYTKTFGPLNYSFNRGNVHFVCLDDIIFSNSSDYTGGFTASQVAWLKQDLSYVPKDKMIIVYYHIPLRNTSSISYRNEILSALQGYTEVHLMCGHTHYNENYIQTTPVAAYEHIHAAACGSWWKSTINGDGTPNGYGVYEIDGAKITNWYYKAVNRPKDFQIRLHKGNASFGGSYGYFNYNQSSDAIIANIWNSDSSWKVEAYENGVKTADLSHMSTSLNDAWSLGYHLGVLNRDPENYTTACKHLYLYKRVNPNATLEIKATDKFGTVYTQKEIVTDLSTAISY